MDARRPPASRCHGRRRAGSGESFWQYRRFVSGEPSQNVDWRRSARDDHLYVREQEWEAAHTVWLWPDRSLSMAFASKGVRDSKLERGLIVTFALAELLVAGGERVGIPGLMNPTASRSVIDKMAQAMLHDSATRASLPPSFVPTSLSEIVVLSDFWSPIAEIKTMADTVTPITVTSPSGATRELTLTAGEPGLWSAATDANELGLWQATDGKLKALINVGPTNPKEFSEVTSTVDTLKPLAQATGGDARRIVSGSSIDLPRVVPVRSSSVFRGDGWLGVRMRDASVVRGVGVLPVFAGLIGLLLLLGAFAATWLREGR